MRQQILKFYRYDISRLSARFEALGIKILNSESKNRREALYARLRKFQHHNSTFT